MSGMLTIFSIKPSRSRPINHYSTHAWLGKWPPQAEAAAHCVQKVNLSMHCPETDCTTAMLLAAATAVAAAAVGPKVCSRATVLGYCAEPQKLLAQLPSINTCATDPL